MTITINIGLYLSVRLFGTSMDAARKSAPIKI